MSLHSVVRIVMKCVATISTLVAVGLSVFALMPLDRSILFSARHAADDVHVAQIELKGKIYYVTPEERRDYLAYRGIVIASIVVGISSMFILRHIRER